MASSITSRQSHDNNSMSVVLSLIDILTLVAQRLANHDLIDLINFAHVCKTWYQAAAILQRQQGSSMPWLFVDRSGRFGLCDFWSSEQNVSHELKISPELRKFITSSRGVAICSSKHGWLLLSKPVCDPTHTKVEFLFFNPFHNKIIELPCLYLDVGEVHKSMITVTRPALARRHSDCVIVIMSGGKDSNRIHRCNPRSRNKKWTSRIMKISDNYDGPGRWCGWFGHPERWSSSTSMNNGTLYCLYEVPYEPILIAIYGIANQDSGVVTTVYSSPSLQELQLWFDFYQLFESNGDLLIAIRFKDKQIGLHWRVYQFDPLIKDGTTYWTPIESLGNRALAMSTRPSDFRRNSVVVLHEAKEFADMIIDSNTTYIRETNDRGSIWRKDKHHEWNFMSGSVAYIEPILFA